MLYSGYTNGVEITQIMNFVLDGRFIAYSSCVLVSIFKVSDISEYEIKLLFSSFPFFITQEVYSLWMCVNGKTEMTNAML